MARSVSGVNRRRHSHTLCATLNQIQATHLPRFLSSEIARRHSQTHRMNLLFPFRTQRLSLPGCLTSLPLSRTSARSQQRSEPYLGKVAGRGICPSCVKEHPWVLGCMIMLPIPTSRRRRPLLPRHYVQVSERCNAARRDVARNLCLRYGRAHLRSLSLALDETPSLTWRGGTR